MRMFVQCEGFVIRSHIGHRAADRLLLVHIVLKPVLALTRPGMKGPRKELSLHDYYAAPVQ